MLIIKVPAVSLSRTRGCEEAPEKIIALLDDIYTNESGLKPVFSVREIKTDSSNLKLSNQIIFEKSKKIFEETNENNEKIIFIGGDHFISYGTVKSFNSCFKNCCLVVFDSHADCMKAIKEPTHEEWLSSLINSGFQAKNVFLIGSRNNDVSENEFLIENKINLFSVNEFNEDLQEATSILMEKIKNYSAVYLSIDIDAVDPAFAPGTGYLEPAGFTSRQFIYIIQHLALLKNLKAADVVEVNPKKDFNDMTSKLAAKIIAELA